MLEVGFGDGYGSAYLSETARKVIGIDYDRQVAFKARRKYRMSNLQFLYMDATKLGFKDKSIDMACSFQVVEHIPAEHLLLYLGEVYRVLKDRGEFYLSTPNIVVNRKGKKTYKMNPAHYQEFTVNEIRKLLSSIFPEVDVFGLQFAFKHTLFQRLKKIGIDKMLPQSFNPVRSFFNKITTDDFLIKSSNLNKSLDIICRCKKL